MMKIRSYEFNWMCCDAHFLNFCSTGAHAGTISFNEYCFRFGRRYQIEHNRRRRNGISVALIAVWVPRWFPGVYRYSVMYLHYSGHIELILLKVPLPTNRPWRARGSRRTLLFVNAAFA